MEEVNWWVALKDFEGIYASISFVKFLIKKVQNRVNMRRCKRNCTQKFSPMVLCSFSTSKRTEKDITCVRQTMVLEMDLEKLFN
jgi:hypothetical protein